MNYENVKVTEVFGSMVFNESVMQARLPKDTFKKVQAAIKTGKRLDSEVAAIVATAMKDWAIEKGATHYTHWFQPMTGFTAEKHDSFISPTGDGKIIMEFSGKELVKGEPDASSFPSGGLRATFEARGYTAWDPTSYAFIKDSVLCIPTAFCSYGGEALDKKTPLLRSMETIEREAMRVLKLFGNENVKGIKTTVGAEQEYFLIDKSVYEKRPDLMFTGRTLFGARPPKGQELDDHYFGSIKSRVAAFMRELDFELWQLGITAKTEHNEVAPGQHELAPVFTTSNIATDHNQLTMELMQRVAKRHGMVCLLHEKPFAGVNGSGKHNNWSLSTDTGMNLLEPGETPSENAQFLLILCAIIKAVDEYQDMLRMSVASAANDHRLGANEAPPAVISIFLGDELTAILEAIKNDTAYVGAETQQIKIGVHSIPKFPKDTTDRNRTSPFAFTGNKFEFRMPGASASISGPNFVLNTAVAEQLKQFADELEGADDFQAKLHALIRRVITQHDRIVFNGNGYDDAWIEQAQERGLLNLKCTTDALPSYLQEKNQKLFTSHKVLSNAEIVSRYEIKTEGYIKAISIEASTMIDMAKKDLLPAASAYVRSLADTINAKREACEKISCAYEENLAVQLSNLMTSAVERVGFLEKAITEMQDFGEESIDLARYCREKVLPEMESLRDCVDQMEANTAKSYWPYPSYADILYSVN